MVNRNASIFFFFLAELKIDRDHQPSLIECSFISVNCEVKDCKEQVSKIFSNVGNGKNYV